jgi:hypothetical protein
VKIEVRAGFATIVFTQPRRCKAMTYAMIGGQPPQLSCQEPRCAPPICGIHPPDASCMALVGIGGVEPIEFLAERFPARATTRFRPCPQTTAIMAAGEGTVSSSLSKRILGRA